MSETKTVTKKRPPRAASAKKSKVSSATPSKPKAKSTRSKATKSAKPKTTMITMELPLEPMKNDQPAICRSCHALPVGSVELVSLLLVLVFSLTAVLFTSVYALELQQQHIDALEAQSTNV